jgi:ribosomal protein S18 acetylase RimI-like enzyme
VRPDAITDADAVTGLIALAAGSERQRMEQALRLYRDNPAAKLLIAVIDHEPVGVVGYTEGDSEVTLLHIATAEHVRRMGVGSRLLAEVRRSAPPGAPIVGETDNDALGFYSATGFVITSLGEKYPGVERFHLRMDSRAGRVSHLGLDR